MAQPNRGRRACARVAARDRRQAQLDWQTAAGGVAVLLLLALMTAACQPTVKVEAPKEPITINLNIQADVRVKLEEQAREDVEANPDVF